MQSNILHKVFQPASTLSLQSCTGHVTQVRNHVKMYPWRKSRNNKECYLDSTSTDYTDRYNMNEFVKKTRKDWQKVIPKDKDNRYNGYNWNDSYRSDPKVAKETSMSKLSRFSNSLRDRESARESIPYSPPENVRGSVLSLYKGYCLEGAGANVPALDEDILNIDLNQSRALKLALITKCIDEFNHDMPGSYLNEIDTIGDVIEYFSTPVRGVNPYDALLQKGDALPANLSLISEPVRFDKETDQYFEGYNALPGIVSKVPGLRAAKKYPILNQDEFQWPDI